MTARQGEVWWAEARDKRRPVLIVTRSHAVAVLSSIIVAPVSRTIRDLSTELALGPAEGLPVACAANFDDLQSVEPSALMQRIGEVGLARQAICQRLEALADC